MLEWLSVFCHIIYKCILSHIYRDAWSDLLDQVELRNQKLQGAAEIHRFNRDVEDALSRIQEKYSSIPEDLGRDLKQVQAYQKSHDSFENELVALEAQVMKTCTKLNLS